ncbi:SufD family Fe-S cluster assembly protein [Altererythrobacter sp. MF3-039]|uniref:SufD family Fe-S cluster assembly protein n=1 Tax=Altererythrobacter sp. MF3-039 TaxID=3252901 RepID=UPI00390C9E66
MNEAATLSRPTTRDEDWRYSDAEFIAEADPRTLAHWTEWSVAPGQNLAKAKIYDSGETASGSIHRIQVHVGAGGRFEMWSVVRAAGFTRLELDVTLEDGAHFEFGGVTIGGGDATQEFVTRVIHAGPNATSNQTVRAVQWGKSTGNFLGRIEVARDAQKTDAGQNFRAILLEKGATANTKPELEIFADDVQCAHGAAIGQLDEVARYYMAARGIPPEVARKLLVQAFIGDAFVEYSNADAAERLLEQALKKLDEAAL